MAIDISCFAPEFREVIGACDEKYAQFRKNLLSKQTGYVLNWPLINKAWEMVVLWHCSPGKPDGYQSGQFISRSEAVMEELMNLRCDSTVIAAGVLYSAVSTGVVGYKALREHFSYQVAELVQAVENIKKRERDIKRSASGDPVEEVMGKISPALRADAFLIRFAEQAYQLRTLKNAAANAAQTDENALRRYYAAADFTDRMLVPIAKALGNTYYRVTLGDLCLAWKNGDHSMDDILRTIDYQRTEAVGFNARIYQQFNEEFLGALQAQSVFSVPSFNPYPGESSQLRRLLKPQEVLEQMGKDGRLDFAQLEMWEIVLTYPEQYRHVALKKFLEMYQGKLRDKGKGANVSPLADSFFIEYVGHTGRSTTLRLTDRLWNNYRIALVPEADLRDYYFGEGSSVRAAGEGSPFDDFWHQRITVHSYSPRKKHSHAHEKFISAGATALDFALKLNPLIGLSAKGVWIEHCRRDGTVPDLSREAPQRALHRYPLETVLSDGDVVYFDTEYDPKGPPLTRDMAQVTLKSLLQVNTQQGKQCLVEYLSDPAAYLKRITEKTAQPAGPAL